MKDKEYLKKYLPKEKYQEGLEKLKQNIPVQYIVGNVNFYGNIINVNENVLIPRFETELLTEKTINYCKKFLDKKIKVLDIGCGSGAISIALKKNLNCDVDAIDISLKALDVAKENAKLNHVDINFYQSDMLKNVDKKFDLIISNPPYISYDEEVEDIVKNNEPNIALYADDNGLKFYKEILKNATKNLNFPSIIAFEIGATQSEDITHIAKKYFPNSKIFTEKDYTKRDRFLFVINEE